MPPDSTLLQKSFMVKTYYFTSLISMSTFFIWGIFQGMDIMPSLIGMALIFPIGLIIFYKENRKKIKISGLILFFLTNIIGTAISIYFGGLKSNTVYFFPIIYAFSPLILPRGRTFLAVTLPTFLLQIFLLYGTQGAGFQKFYFEESEFFQVMTLTLVVVICGIVLINYFFFNLIGRLTEELYEDKVMLEKLHLEKKKLLSIMFHDLTNYLSAASYRLGPKKLSQGEFLNESHQKGYDNLNKMIELVRHVKEIEVLENKQLDLSQKINLNKLIDESLELFAERISAKNLTVKKKFSEGLLEKTVFSNYTALQTNVLNNLLSNAVKFSPQGDTLFIEVLSCDTENLRSSSFSLTVTNSSLKIPEHIKSTIFQITHQNSSLGSAGEVGSGFGLAIAFDAAKKLGGELSLTEKAGQVSFIFQTW